jgi:ABC-type molybdenum transport system ATPase subunit/photorepair protein PhrA
MNATADQAVARNNGRSNVERQGVRLQVRGLRKSYNGHEVLRDINFEVNAGEIFVIMGPSRQDGAAQAAHRP